MPRQSAGFSIFSVRKTERSAATHCAAVVGHSTALTTTRFYEGVKVPVVIKIPIPLEHPDDPPRAMPMGHFGTRVSKES